MTNLRHRTVEQAVVVPQDKLNYNQISRNLALFDEDGNSIDLGALANRPEQQLVHYSTGNSSELVATIPINLTASEKIVVYSIEIPDLEIGDVLYVTADMQATNDQTYNALFSTQIILGETISTVAGTEITEGAGTNITPDNHHMQFCRSGSVVVASTSRKFVNFVAAAAASNALEGHEMTIDSDYGRLSVMRLRTVSGVLGSVPIISDDTSSLVTVYSSAKILELLSTLTDDVGAALGISEIEADVEALQMRQPAAEAFASSPVATLARQNVATSVGTVASGTSLAARARVLASGVYTKVRFCTGTTAPSGLTDFRVGVWNASDGTPIETSANASATVTAASTLYEISLSNPVSLTIGQEVYIGVAVVGTTPGTYRGNASFNQINDISPSVSKARTGWAGGALMNLTASYSGIIWAELIP